jgi:hypothetical protein
MHYIILVVVQVDFYMLLIYSRSCWPIASISEPVSLLDFQLVVIQPANSWSWLVKSVVTIYYTLMKICHPTNNWLNGRTTQQVLFYGHHILRTSKQAKNSLTSMDPFFFSLAAYSDIWSSGVEHIWYWGPPCQGFSTRTCIFDAISVHLSSQCFSFIKKSQCFS